MEIIDCGVEMNKSFLLKQMLMAIIKDSFMKKFTSIFFLIILFSGYSFCENKLAIGLGYPYISGKYNFSEKTASEFRFATGSGINVYAGRFYWNFKKYDKVNLFTGLEGGYVNFNTLDMKGSGYETGIFVGGEYFITHNLSFALDFAPILIGLKSDKYKVNGVEFVFNAGLYIYFGSSGR